MKIGFLLHRQFKKLSFEDVVKWGSENGFAAIDIRDEWPENAQDFLSKYNMEIGATQVGMNIFTPNSKELEENIKKVCDTIEATAQIDVKVIVAFLSPIRRELSIADNFKIFEKVFPRILDCAQSSDVKIAFENWPDGNLAYSPETWDKIFEAFPSKNLGLCFDPSHLYWLGVDYVRAVKEFGDRIYHVHAKDTEILKDGLYRFSIFSRQFPEYAFAWAWWRYRLPGFGEINWTKFISALYEVDYNGTISIEHEDPFFSRNIDMVKKGFILAKRKLEQYI